MHMHRKARGFEGGKWEIWGENVKFQIWAGEVWHFEGDNTKFCSKEIGHCARADFLLWFYLLYPDAIGLGLYEIRSANYLMLNECRRNPCCIWGVNFSLHLPEANLTTLHFAVCDSQAPYHVAVRLTAYIDLSRCKLPCMLHMNSAWVIFAPSLFPRWGEVHVPMDTQSLWMPPFGK